VIEGTDNLGTITPFTGEEAIDRIKVMFLYVAKSIRDPLARTILAEAVAGVPERDDWAEVQAVYWYVRKHVRYTGDTRDLDTYQSLRRIWPTTGLGIGDCDDFTIAYMSILLSGGYRTGASIISQDGQTYSHVYAVVELPRNDPTPSNRRIIPLDGTVPSAFPGWEPDKSQRKLERLFWFSVNSQ
jgi:transglutaminase-like putative cysteine protease